MSAPDLELRPLDAVSTSEIIALLRVCLGDGERRSEAFWHWKHRQNPFGTSPGVAAFAGDKLIGIRVFMRWEWLVDGRRLRAVRAVDTATHPDVRRQGLFRRLTEALVSTVEEEGVDFIFNTPNARSREGYLKMGWSAVAKLPVLARIAGPSSWLRRRKSAGTQGTDASRNPTAVGALLEDERVEGFLARASESAGRLRTPRTVEFLRWRYENPPGLGYGALWKLDDRGSGAAVIARSSLRRGLRELLLSEVLSSDDDVGREAAASLLRRLGTLGEHDYCVAHASQGTPERRALLRSGFAIVPRVGPYLTVRRLRRSSSSVDPTLLASWRLGLGDLEIF